MKKLNTVEKVTEIITPVITEMGFELVDTEYIKEGPEWYLRVYIDHENGIDLNACERVSRKIDAVLEEHDHNNAIFPGSYILEVSSPGITRPLKKEQDFARTLGKMVTVKTYMPVNGKKEFNGILKDYSDEAILLQIDQQDLSLARNKIGLIHLAITFN